MPKSALAAMSGGVDSAAAVRLSVAEGLDCAGAIMRLHDSAATAVNDARNAAALLGIPFYELDFSNEFERCVILPFIAEYRAGKTPNPCIVCNKHLKFGLFLKTALDFGKDYVITGHYARCDYDSVSGRYFLKKALDCTKDQSYFLYTLSQEQLARVRFPLGVLTKDKVREIARNAGFVSADRPESQDICFVPDGGHASFIETHTGKSAPHGRFVDISGNDLGGHRGITAYTIGQRRGLGLAMPYPAYVLGIRPCDNTVVVGRNELLYSKNFTVRNINLIAVDLIEKPLKASVKIRGRHTEQPATVRQTGLDVLEITFDEAQRAITPGQSAVIYEGDIVIGGGVIV